MTDDLDQTLLLLVGVFAFFIVLLIVLTGMERRLNDPPGQHSWSPRRWASSARQAGRDTRARRRTGK